MTAIENFTLANLPGAVQKPDLTDRFFNLFSRVEKKEWQEPETRSRVLFDGQQNGAEINGISTRAQFRHRDGYVLFTAYDGYADEETYVSFLDFDFKVLDELTLDGFFSRGGSAFDFTVVSADTIEFSIYQEEEKRRLKIYNPPAAEFPANCAELTARSLSRHFSKHYLKLETEII